MSEYLSVEQGEGRDENGYRERDGVEQGGLRALVALSLEPPAALDE